jgi:SAM-dependent methyltransferase
MGPVYHIATRPGAVIGWAAARGSRVMSRSFVPAAGHDLLLPLYDPLWRLMGGARVRATFLREAGLAAPQRVLDVGCGTGSLAVDVARALPGASVTALDPDPKALARAAEKAAVAGVDVCFDQGFAEELPYDTGFFDRVVSSFMFHHLDRETKHAMLCEVRRVLAPGGELHLVDFGGSGTGTGGLVARLLHRHEHAVENRGTANLDPALFAGAGFVDVAEVSQHRSLFGRYAHVRAVAPRGPSRPTAAHTGG